MTRMYPDICLQNFIEPWWIEDENHDYWIGRLLWAFVPHVDQVPATLIAEGREDPTNHRNVKYRIEPLQINKTSRDTRLPVAAFPVYLGEVRAVYRAKRRPVLVVGKGGYDVQNSLRKGFPKWQTSPSILVAPFYGVENIDSRSGWPEKLVERIRRCEYPQYLWDQLPIDSRTKESILRLDQIQPIGKHHFSLEWTKHRLSDYAFTILREQITWLFWGEFPENSKFFKTREFLLSL